MSDIQNKRLVLTHEVNSGIEAIADNDLIHDNEERADIKDAILFRAAGDFKERAFYLPKKYNWSLGVDDMGELVLVPTCKEATTHETDS
jgi:hypothetical protein